MTEQGPISTDESLSLMNDYQVAEAFARVVNDNGGSSREELVGAEAVAMVIVKPERIGEWATPDEVEAVRKYGGELLRRAVKAHGLTAEDLFGDNK